MVNRVAREHILPLPCPVFDWTVITRRVLDQDCLVCLRSGVLPLGGLVELTVLTCDQSLDLAFEGADALLLGRDRAAPWGVCLVLEL